jgi:hypothetical protein
VGREEWNSNDSSSNLRRRKNDLDYYSKVDSIRGAVDKEEKAEILQVEY